MYNIIYRPPKPLMGEPVWLVSKPIWLVHGGNNPYYRIWETIRHYDTILINTSLRSCWYCDPYCPILCKTAEGNVLHSLYLTTIALSPIFHYTDLYLVCIHLFLVTPLQIIPWKSLALTGCQKITRILGQETQKGPPQDHGTASRYI